MKEIYVIMRLDRYLFSDRQIQQWDIRSIKAYSTYEDAKAECERLQSLKDIKDVEYFIDAAKLMG